MTNLARDFNGTVNFTVIAALEDADGFDGDWNVTVYAVCANAPDNLTTASTTTRPSSVSKSATVTCPAHTRVHSAWVS